MKNLIYIFTFTFIFSSFAISQPVIWSEGFESLDSLSVPSGWSKYNNSPLDTIEPNWNWTVRTVGTSLPGLSTSTAVAHSGTKSIGISWYMGASSGVSDGWLVTSRLQNVPADALFSFWLTGGSPSFSDSLSIWISTTGNQPSDFLSGTGARYDNIFFPVGSVYGNFEQHFVTLSAYTGQNIYIGFRYNMNTAVNGYFVQLDDVEYQGTVGITQIGTTVPDKFALNQNYPNPFNPGTKISFDLARNSNVKLTVFNSVGQKVMNIFEGNRPAGSYIATFDGSSLSSGVYFYRLETEYFTETKKMQLIK